MNDLNCHNFDEEYFVERYIAGELSAAEKNDFELHLQTCPVHAKAVALEKALKKGVKEFARNEIKSAIKKKYKKKEENRILILRFAAIFFLVVITPLILYYHYQYDMENEISILPAEKIQKKVAEKKEAVNLVAEDKVPEKKVKSALKVQEKQKLESSQKLPRFEEKIINDGSIIPESQSPSSIAGSGGVSSAEGEKLSVNAKRIAEEQTNNISEKSILISMDKKQIGNKRIEKIIYKKNKESVSDSLYENITTNLAAVDEHLKECISKIAEKEEFSLNELRFMFEISSTGKILNLRSLQINKIKTDLKSCLVDVLQSANFQNTKEDIIVIHNLKLNE